MKILITAFDPFGGEKINPALEVIKGLDDNIESCQLIKLEIPTVFGKAEEVIERKIKEVRPDVILSLGQAGGRSDISVERVAINIDDAKISDNEGNMPIDEKIREDGDTAYFATIPIKAIVEEIRKEKLPASISNTAGTFLCNHVMYQDLYLAKKYGNMRAGFIHIPFLPDQVLDKKDTASMNLDDMLRAIRAAIRAIIKYEDKQDLKIRGGACH